MEVWIHLEQKTKVLSYCGKKIGKNKMDWFITAPYHYYFKNKKESYMMGEIDVFIKWLGEIWLSK